MDLNVGIAGMGLMGIKIATRLLKTGHIVSVYNRNKSKANSLSMLGANVLDTPSQLAQACDLVIVCVTNFEAVKDVCFGKNGLCSISTKKCNTVVDSSTISPEQAQYCATKLRSNKIDMLSMPVMGGPAAAEKGELVPIVSGNRDSFSRIVQVINDIAKSIFYVGEVDGSANSVKLALNLNIAVIACALSEGMAMIKKSGIEPHIFLDVLNSTYFKTGLSEIKGPNMIKGDYEPSFYLKNMLKDLELVIVNSLSIGVSLPIAATTHQMFRAANNSGYSNLDYTAISAFINKINGID